MVGFVYKIVEITAASSDNGSGQVLGLLCVERNGADSSLAVHVFPVELFLSFGSSHLLVTGLTLL